MEISIGGRVLLVFLVKGGRSDSAHLAAIQCLSYFKDKFVTAIGPDDPVIIDDKGARLS